MQPIRRSAQSSLEYDKALRSAYRAYQYRHTQSWKCRNCGEDYSDRKLHRRFCEFRRFIVYRDTKQGYKAHCSCKNNKPDTHCLPSFFRSCYPRFQILKQEEHNPPSLFELCFAGIFYYEINNDLLPPHVFEQLKFIFKKKKYE